MNMSAFFLGAACMILLGMLSQMRRQTAAQERIADALEGLQDHADFETSAPKE